MSDKSFGLSFEKNELSNEEMNKLINATPTQIKKDDSSKQAKKSQVSIRKPDPTHEYWSAQREGMYCKVSEKRVYSAHAADVAIVEAARDISAPVLNKYKCEHCSGWHLTRRQNLF